LIKTLIYGGVYKSLKIITAFFKGMKD